MKKLTVLFLALLLIVVPVSTVQASEGDISRSGFIKTINETFHIYTVLDTDEAFSDIDLKNEDYLGSNAFEDIFSTVRNLQISGK